jgi:hypothetical protein
MAAQRAMDALALCVQHEVDMQVRRICRRPPRRSNSSTGGCSRGLESTARRHAGKALQRPLPHRDATFTSRIVTPIAHHHQSADSAHTSRQHDLLSQLSKSIAAVAASLADTPACSLQNPQQSPAAIVDDSPRVRELEQEVETLRSSLSSRELLGSAAACIGRRASSDVPPSFTNHLPEQQVRICDVVCSIRRNLFVDAI